MAYDPSVLRLYCRYLGLTGALVTVLLALCGAAAGFALGAVTRAHGNTFAVAGAVAAALAGFLWSYSRRVHAQQILCQVEIEEHLRAMRAMTAAQLPQQQYGQQAQQR